MRFSLFPRPLTKGPTPGDLLRLCDNARHRLPDGDEIDWTGAYQPVNPRDFESAARIAGGSDGVDHDRKDRP